MLVKAKKEDIHQLMDLYRNIIENTKDMEIYGRWKKGLYPTEADIQYYLDYDSMYIAYQDTKCIGAIGITFFQGKVYKEISWKCTSDKVAVLHVLGVHPDYQGKGYAKKIIKEAENLSLKVGMEVIRLDALASNTPAHSLYKSLGYIYCGTKNMYADNTGWTDFYFFEKEIKNT